MIQFWPHIPVFILFLLLWRYFGNPKSAPKEAFRSISGRFKKEEIYSRLNLAAERQEEKDWVALERALSHPDFDVAATASKLLSEINDSRAVEILMEHINKLDQEISSTRLYAREEIHHITPHESESIHWNLFHPRLMELEEKITKQYAFHPFEKMTPGLLKQALHAIADNDGEQSSIRFYALESMKALASPPDDRIIQKLLGSDEPLIIQGAASIAGFHQMKKHEMELIKLLKHRNPGVVLECIYALGEMKSGTSLPAISSLTKHENALIQQAARETAGRIRTL
jgi:HEAT repeat protein